ncbi:MAG: GMC family oxidoreductase [Candidatus Omnitrophica bacterium]|nr:GMC family oxidoreductase [Candidatus Omnitrophota bacterium]
MKKKIKMKCDVVVVGSGPGGATIARELTLKGKNVIILEWGKDNPPGARILLDPFKYLGGFGMRKNAILKTKNNSMTMVRGITTGGSTMVYGGAAWEPPMDKFSEYGFNLSEEVEEIKKEIAIQPLPDELIGPRGKLIMKSALELGLEWKKIDRLFKDPGKCKFGDNSYFFGDRTGSRWCARDWVMDAVNNGAPLMNETYCEEVIIEGDKAAGVIATDRIGREIEIGADKVVVAAGGIGSPMILQRSGIFEAGRSFFNEPCLLAFGYVGTGLKPAKEQTRQAGILLEEDGIALADMALPMLGYKQAAFKASKFSKAFKAKKLLTVLVEIADDPSGSVSLTGEIVKTLSEEDQFKINKGMILARKILQNAGARDIWFSGIDNSAHPGGTCKIGDVIDSNLKTRIDNVYVADASVLPKSMAIPPVLTILALAKRLSKQLI